MSEKKLTIGDHMRAIEELGGRAIVWVPDDFPGDTEEEREEQFDEHIDTVIDVSIERGSDAIDNLCGN